MSTATEKFNKKYAEVVKTIEKNFADLKAGEKMLIFFSKIYCKLRSKNTLWNRKIREVNTTRVSRKYQCR